MHRLAHSLALAAPIALAACGGSSGPAADAEAGKLAADMLCEVWVKAGGACTVEAADGTPGKASADGHAFAVTVTPLQESPLQVETLVNLQVDLSVDGTARPGWGGNQVGRGADRAKAIRHALNEWSAITLVPAIDALRNTGSSQALAGIHDLPAAPSALPQGRHAVYLGHTQLKGATRDKQPIDAAGLLSAVAPRAEGWADDALHTITVVMEVSINRLSGTETRQCTSTVDGVPDEALCELARAFDWPKGGPGYIARQTYVFAPKPAGWPPAVPAVDPSAAPSGEPSPADTASPDPDEATTP